MKGLFILLQYLTPQHLLSRLAGVLAETRIRWLKNLLIRLFIRVYKVDMTQALLEDYKAFDNFNSFFTRALKADARPVAEGPALIACPADGAINAAGSIADQRIFQAKGKSYTLAALLGGNEARTRPFLNGQFITIYLAPRDYHRVHMPVSGTLKEMHYIPGKLFSVNQTTAENIDNLFARNERLVCLFETHSGPMAVILVGAMIVAGIETVWAGRTAADGNKIKSTVYPQSRPIILRKGEELGRFKLGSTVIVLFGKDTCSWDPSLVTCAQVRMGETVGKFL